MAAWVRQANGTQRRATRSAKKPTASSSGSIETWSRVDDGDHHEGHQVVDHRQGEQAEAEAGAARREERQHPEGESRIGRHRGAPAVRPRAAGVERQEDRDRYRHPAERGGHG